MKDLKAIIRSTAMIGGSSVTVLAIGMVRSKFFALFVGPGGIGAIGILNSFLNLAATFGSLGIGTSGVGLIASSDSNPQAVLALRLLSVILATACAVAVFLLRTPIATLVMGQPELSISIGWLSLGVFLSILVIGQAAIITGRRRFRDLFKLQAGGALVGAVIGVAVVGRWGMAGVVAAVIAAPAASFLVGFLILRRGAARLAESSRRQIAAHSRSLLQLGVPITAAAVLTAAVQLAMRSLVLQKLGLDQTGLYQAALAITSLNLGLVLAALGTDFFPRLAAGGQASETMSRMANDQLWIVCLLSAPILLALASGAQWWLGLFYSGKFVDAQSLLRWQALGEVCRIPAWVFGYVLLVRRDARAYFVHELSNAAVLPLAFLFIPKFGLAGAGIAYVVSYLFCVTVTLTLVGFRHGIYMSLRSYGAFAALLALIALLIFSIPSFPVAIPVAGLVGSAACGLAVLAWLHSHDALPAPAAKLAGLIWTGTSGD